MDYYSILVAVCSPLKDFKKHHTDLIGTRIEESMLDEKRILEMYQKFNLAKE
ncbi:hypothetical protein [Helicobacter pylori]|uniref:hypothetical protein n=1 Tax=Helicobacter pylori TaxID=210 RepID=UPI00398BCDD2